MPPLKILLIEDHPDSNESLRMLIELMGHQVKAAFLGNEGLQLAAAESFDAALIDLTLPDIDGLDVGRRLAAETSRPYLIAYTAWGRHEDIERTREAGFDTHMLKPVDPAQLESLLTSLGRGGKH